jgi:hypothetical protein
MPFRYLLIVAISLLACASISAPLKNPDSQSLRIISIPKGETSFPRAVGGKLTLLATPSSNVDPEMIVFFIGDKEIGRATRHPFSVIWDTMTVPDGNYIVKWAAVGSSGEGLDFGAITLNVINKTRVTITEDTPSGKTKTKPKQNNQNNSRRETVTGNKQPKTDDARVTQQKTTKNSTKKITLSGMSPPTCLRIGRTDIGWFYRPCR